MIESKKWGIIGAGWLGSELASRLEDDYWGTNRKTFNWESDNFPTSPCEFLLLNTPPLTDISPIDFVSKINLDRVNKAIFISSIGVYGLVTGIVTESTIPRPETKNGIWLYEVEKLLISKFEKKITIIRAGGLIGGLRHPVFSLSKRPSQIVNDGLINLIHRDDLIEIIFAVSRIENAPSILNAVTPYHPLKSIYYQHWSKKLNLNSISFSSNIEVTREVGSDLLHQLYPNWLCLELDRL